MRMEEDGYGSSGGAPPGAADDEPLSGLEEGGEEEMGEEEASDSPRTQLIKANIRVVSPGGRLRGPGGGTRAAGGGGGGGYAAAAGRAHWSH